MYIMNLMDEIQKDPNPASKLIEELVETFPWGAEAT